MSGLEVAGVVLAAIPLAISSYQTFRDRLDNISGRFNEFSELKKKRSPLQALVLVSLFPDAKEFIQQTETHVLQSDGDEPMAMKRSIAEDCNMLAVSVSITTVHVIIEVVDKFHYDQSAIIAQVAITALSLENLNSVHWTARACFIASLVTGVLSVFYACLVQQQISSLLGPDDVKDWLSKKIDRPETFEPLPARRKELEEVIHKLQKDLQEKRWGSASFNAAVMVQVPSWLLNWSVTAFIPGIGIYLGHVWRRNLDPPQPQGSSLAVLIVYLVVTVFGLVAFFSPSTLKTFEIDQIKKHRDQILEAKRKLDVVPDEQHNDRARSGVDRIKMRSFTVLSCIHEFLAAAKASRLTNDLINPYSPCNQNFISNKSAVRELLIFLWIQTSPHYPEDKKLISKKSGWPLFSKHQFERTNRAYGRFEGSCRITIQAKHANEDLFKSFMPVDETR